ncbi:Putative SGNH hydrolase-type esterase domain, SGNH hydrolase superfamily [Colletotrichum destructivum]|uniref:SGNH hydrolase-type esterase domain, SGNH hydrolase superfamily n=1 Tax=Colletotrichum destructivum TaxID=34406 RepID=A0AAX4I3Z4_9PEZI|nr:Putative SGNH hydrolase-type esterase domain, SGNH hydrolase superfamily [Colletotrichum destructivum]
MSEERTIRIFCFGDSLTAGYSAYGAVYHPYSITLAKKLSRDLSNTRVVATDNGMPGDLVSQGAFEKRFESEMSQNTYDWVIVLGGTNDLAYSVPPERIFDSLRRVYDSAVAKGSKVLALTVPERAAKNEGLETLRRQLNNAILSYQSPNYHAFDLNSRIPYHSLTERERKRYWDDGLHLTAAGYDWMGAHVAEALGDLVELERNPDSRRARRARRHIEEEICFDEEDGDPRSLSGGYVVVRMRDLN